MIDKLCGSLDMYLERTGTRDALACSSRASSSQISHPSQIGGPCLASRSNVTGICFAFIKINRLL